MPQSEYQKLTMNKVIEQQRRKIIKIGRITNEYIDALLSVTKNKLGIMSTVRDEYITSRCLASLYALISEKNIKIDMNDTNHMLFLADYTCWQYRNVDGAGAMPEDLRFRLNNLIMKNTGDE